jgi:DNA polymerase III delta prime subunit
MTNDAQNALRRIMEKFTENVRFCLIGNYLSKIIPALQSRSVKLRRIFICDKKLEEKKRCEVLRIRPLNPGSGIIVFRIPVFRSQIPDAKSIFLRTY